MKYLLFLLMLLTLLAPAAHATQSVTLAWDPNSEPNLAGYRLYYGAAPRVYFSVIEVPVSPTPQATVTGLEPGVTYYFAVTAFTDDGLESKYSDEVSYLVPGVVRPPTLVYSVEKGMIAWEATNSFFDWLETSTDLVTWTVLPGPHELRGVHYVYRFYDPAEPRRFFRIRRDMVVVNPR